jgi:hypothetical protein
MKHIKLYEDFVNEATTSWKKMMQGVRSSETGPWSIVAIQDRKVVGQSIDIKIQDLIPAKYEGLKKEFPKAKLHIEDGTGMVVWNESKYNGNISGDAAEYIAKELSQYVKGIIDQPNDNMTYFHLKDKSYKSKVIKTLLDIYGIEAKDGGNLFSPSPTISFSNDIIVESKDLNEGGGTLKVEKEKDGKYYWTFTFKSGKVEKWPNGFATSAEAQKDFMYRSKHLKEGTYNSKREIAIYDGAEGLTHIEKRGKGYYGYNDEFDFEATDKADLEKKLKSWKYKLISGSIDENVTELDEAVKIQPGMGAFYSYTSNHKLIEKIFKEAFKGQEDKLYRANFFNTGAPCIKFELKNQSSWQLVYYPGQVYLEDHGLGSISLYPYGPQDSRYLVFKVGVKGNRRFGDTKMTPAEIKEAAIEFKNWVNNK